MKLKALFFIIVILQGLFIQLSAQQIKYVVSPDNNFSGISNFSEGLARVSISYDSTGFIDTTGKFAFSNKFEYAGDFHCGRAYVRKVTDGKSKFGFIDNSGRLVIPYIYDEVEDFSCNRALVNDDGIWKVIDKYGTVVMNDSLLMTETEIIDVSAESKRWEDTEPPQFFDGLMQVRTSEKYGYADTSGNIVIPCSYYSASYFSDGVAIVAADTIDGGLRYKGFNTLDNLYNSLPPGPREYRWSIINTVGHVVFKVDGNYSLDLNRDFSNRLLPVQDSLGRWGFINTTGKVVIMPQFYNEPQSFSDGISIIQVNGKQDGYILLVNTLGNIVSKIPFCNQYGCIYDSNFAFYEGLLAVKVDDKWGYMDMHGTLVIPPQFDTALDFHDGRAVVVTSDGKVAVIVNPLRAY